MDIKAIKEKELFERYHFRCVHHHTGISHPSCFDQAKSLGERIGFLDIESSGLKATFGFMISYCIKKEDGEIIKRCVTPRDIRTGVFDKNLCIQFLKDIEQFDRLVTFYGTRFDIKFLRTRCIKHGLVFPPFGTKMHTDLYFMVKNRLLLHSNRLQTACDFLGIPSKGHSMNPEVWHNAMAGQQKALDWILLHNIEDVISTELLWKKMQTFTKINKTSW